MENNKSKKKEKKKNFDKTKNIMGIIYFLLGILFFLAFFGVFDYIDDTTSEILYPTEVVYDFEDDVIGTFPDGWYGSQWNGTEVITWEKDEVHGQVAEVENRDGRNVEVATRFKKAKRGTIEFDIYCNYDERVNIDITQLTEDYDPVDDISINFGGYGEITLKDDNGVWNKISSFSVEKWYHFKIEFNMEYWELWIDDEQVLFRQGFLINYQEKPPYFCQLYFATYVDDNRFYIDNVEINVIKVL